MLKKKNLYLIILGIVLVLIAGTASYFSFLGSGHKAPWGTIAVSTDKYPAGDHNKLVVITRNDLCSYYLYQDEPQGFEYELAKAFAEHMGLELEMVSGTGWEDIHDALLEGQADIIAGIAISPDKAQQFRFSNTYLTTRFVPITNKKSAKIAKLEDFANYDVYVAYGSAYQEELDKLLTANVGLNAYYHNDKTTDDFVKGVAEGRFEATLAYEYVAAYYARHYPNINVGMVLKDEVDLAWAVSKRNKKLAQEINKFLAEMQETGELEKLYNRYFGIAQEQTYNELESFYRRIKRSMPAYTTAIRNSAYQHGFDWRLIAAVIYQESAFNPYAVSYSGAAGLMQLMPETAQSLGLDEDIVYDTSKNIAAGTRYLKRMYDTFKDVATEEDRVKLALSAYNAGIGHVLDARKIAETKGLDKNSWEVIAEMLPLLMQREYYSKAKHGYYKGTETVAYVNNIMVYYDILKYQGTNFNVMLINDISNDMSIED